MNVLSMVAVAVLAAYLAVLLRRYHPEIAVLVTVAAGVLMVAAMVQDVVPLLGTVREWFARSGLPSEYAQLIFKALGVCLLTQLASDACRDAGEQGMANKVDLVGKAVLLTMALPLFEKIGNMAVALMER